MPSPDLFTAIASPGPHPRARQILFGRDILHASLGFFPVTIFIFRLGFPAILYSGCAKYIILAVQFFSEKRGSYAESSAGTNTRRFDSSLQVALSSQRPLSVHSKKFPNR
jgi:hypothetical protein